LNTLLLAATVAFLFLAPFSGSAGLRIAMLFLAALALLFSRGRTRFANGPGVPRAVAIAYGAWVLLACASAAWSELPRYTLAELRAEILYGTVAFAVFFFAATDIARWRWWWGTIIVGSLAVLLAARVQPLLPLELSNSLDGGPGYWSTHLVMVAPLLLVLAWPAPWGQGRSAAIQTAALLLVLAAAWDTENRIVWAAFGAELLTAFAMSGAMPSVDPQRLRNLRRAILVATAAVVIAFGATIVERNDRLFSSSSPVTTGLQRDLRPMIWAVAWEEFKSAPWLGHGFGREILAAKFLPHTPKTPGPALRHGHNVFADIALELGAAGLAIFVALMAALVREYRGFLRDPVAAPLGVIGIMVIAGFLVKNLTDDFFYRHNALIFWSLNGMLLGFGRLARRPP
jgi:O-antigen ligase